MAKVLELQFQPSVLPVNIQGRFPLGWTGWMSLQSKELSRVSQKHKFLGAQPSLWSGSHIHTGTSAKMVPCINLSCQVYRVTSNYGETRKSVKQGQKMILIYIAGKMECIPLY